MTLEAGFDRSYLDGPAIDLPVAATDSVRADLRRTTAGEAVRHCTHFSLSMSASRRLCRWVAWNIDGAHKVSTADDKRQFELDPAYAPGDQIGGKLYKDNHLDQGHIAAFADVSWGTAGEAARARLESCYFSNITPQLDSFNRSDLKGIWGDLENEIAKENKVAGQRLSELAGPFFGDNDVPYEGILVPRDFWKVVAYSEDGALRAKGFVMTQQDLDGKLLLALDEYRIYQHKLAELQAKLGLNLGALVAADTAAVPVKEARAATPTVRRVTSIAEVNAPGW
jgi:endonuclease G, mitochondrial